MITLPTEKELEKLMDEIRQSPQLYLINKNRNGAVPKDYTIPYM